jgi:hypothetical protein
MAEGIARRIFFACGENPFHFLTREGQRRIRRDLRRLHAEHVIRLHPLGLMAELEERSQPLEILVCRDRRIRPRRAELAQRIDVELAGIRAPSTAASYRRLALPSSHASSV